MTALMHASENDHYSAIDMLISKGAVVNTKDNNRKTALNHACGPVVKFLQKYGAIKG